MCFSRTPPFTSEAERVACIFLLPWHSLFSFGCRHSNLRDFRLERWPNQGWNLDSSLGCQRFPFWWNSWCPAPQRGHLAFPPTGSIVLFLSLALLARAQTELWSIHFAFEQGPMKLRRIEGNGPYLQGKWLCSPRWMTGSIVSSFLRPCCCLIRFLLLVDAKWLGNRAIFSFGEYDIGEGPNTTWGCSRIPIWTFNPESR